MVEDWKFKLQQSEQAANQLLLDLQLSNQSLEEVQETATTTRLALEGALDDCRDQMQHQNQAIETKREVMENLEEHECEKIREKQIWSTTHAFTMLNLHDENARHPYYGIRCQSRRMSGSIKKVRRKHPAAEVIYTQRKVPNAINLFTRLKEQRIVAHCRNYCLPTCTEQQLLYHLHSLCGTSYPDSNPAPHNICLESPTSPVSDNFELLF